MAIQYTTKLGDLEIELAVPGSGWLNKGQIVVYGPPDGKGVKTGYRSDVSRRDMLEFIETVRRLM